MNSIKIVRDIKSKNQIQGQLFVLNEKAEIVFRCFTLELPWLNNSKRISAIPEGKYDVKKRYSKKYDWHLELLKVPKRSFILIHEANFVRQLLGCIAVGEKRIDIDKDGLIDVTSSVKTKIELLKHLSEETILTISSLN
jgi:hypothetical protein